MSISPSALSMSPSALRILPSAQFKCVDTKDWMLNDDPRKTCKWIRNRPNPAKYCERHHTAKKNCAKSCVTCCTDDNSYEFKSVLNGNIQNCAWITQNENKIKKRKENCETKEVRKNCRKTCNNCKMASNTKGNKK